MIVALFDDMAGKVGLDFSAKKTVYPAFCRLCPRSIRVIFNLAEIRLVTVLYVSRWPGYSRSSISVAKVHPQLVFLATRMFAIVDMARLWRITGCMAAACFHVLA